jgi:hypothetical protein
MGRGKGKTCVVYCSEGRGAVVLLGCVAAGIVFGVGARWMA